MPNIKKIKAFSLIELSIVILIIGILVVGVTQSSRLLKQVKLATAQNLTRSSPVHHRNLAFWWESTLDDSFINSEAVDGSEISQWNDINPATTTKINGCKGQKSVSAFNYDVSPYGVIKGPIYIADGINNLPTLRFINPGSYATYIMTDTKFKNSGNENLTVILVVSYRSGDGYLIDRMCQSNSGNQTSVPCGTSAILQGQPLFDVYFQAGNLYTLVRDNSGVGTSFDVFGSSYLSSKKPFIFTQERKYGKTVTSYINGKQVASIVDNMGLTNLDMVKIGRHSENSSDSTSFDLSEIAYYIGSISNEDRDAIEEYFGKKYNIKVSNQ